MDARLAGLLGNGAGSGGEIIRGLIGLTILAERLVRLGVDVLEAGSERLLLFVFAGSFAVLGGRGLEADAFALVVLARVGFFLAVTAGHMPSCIDS